MPAEIHQPRNPFLIFGDGISAQLVNMKTDVDTDGTEVIVVRIRPTAALRQKYGIKEEELDTEWCVIKKYPSEFLITGNDDPRWPSKFILCNYLGQETPLSTRNLELLGDIRNLKKQMSSLHAQLAFLHEQYRKITSEAPEWAKIWSRTQKVMRPKRDTDEEEERQYRPAYPGGE